MTPPSRPTRAPGSTLHPRPRRWGLPAALIVGVACAAPAPAAAAPAVKVSMTPLAKPLSTSPSKATVTVRNATRRRLTGLTLSVRPPKGVVVTVVGAKRGTTTRTMKALKARGSARVALRLRRTATGPTAGRLTVKVTRRGKAVGTGRLAFGATPRPTPKPAPKPTPTPAPAPPPLTGRYFWTATLGAGLTTERRSLYFTGPNLVHVEATGSAWPACAPADPACRAYAYDPATGKLEINGTPATLEGRKLVLDGVTHLELGAPPPGTRWDTALTHMNVSGLCPAYCNYYREDLTFRPDGTFIRGAVSSGSGGGGDWAVIPDDSKGTYEVRADRTLRLAFADGKERIETVGQYMNDDGTLQPVGDGLVLGGDGYFDLPD
jgi:hypothetical protein